MTQFYFQPVLNLKKDLFESKFWSELLIRVTFCSRIRGLDALFLAIITEYLELECIFTEPFLDETTFSTFVFHL